MNVFEQKEELRKKVKQLKKQLTLEQKKQRSENIWNQLEILPNFKMAKTVLCYWSMPDEVHTHDFVLKYYRRKRILLPVIVGDELILKVFDGYENMTESSFFNVLEPAGHEFVNYKEIDFAIIPGIAFDENNNRLGRGKAYYDKLFATMHAYSVGVCFDFQYFKSVPHEPHDKPMSQVIRG